MSSTVAPMPAPSTAIPAGSPPARASGRHGRLAWLGNEPALWTLGLLLVPVIWHLFSLVNDDKLVVGPLDVARAFGDLTASGELLTAAQSSGAVLASGLVAGAIPGLLVGILLGRFRLLDVVVDPYINAAFATPLVAIVPILIVALGFGVEAKIVIVALFVFFPVAINTATGVREVPRDLVELARSFCSTELKIWRDVLVPGALPYIVTGFRLAIGRALIAVVVAEFSTSVTGLGFMILRYSRRFRMAEGLVPVVLLMIVGFVLYWLLKRIEKRLSVWRAAP
jgi:NitT/TauT family transport system permease protein